MTQGDTHEHENIKYFHTKNKKPFIAKDKSCVRVFYRSANMNMAEVVVEVGETTEWHYHKKSVEIYYILKGYGMMEMGGGERKVSREQVIIIPRMKKHRIRNIGDEPLRFLCLCAPSYEDEDMVLVGLHKRDDYLIRFLPKEKR